MKKKIILNILAILGIILLLLAKIAASFLNTRYQLILISPCLPVVINLFIFLLLGLLPICNLAHGKKQGWLFRGLLLLGAMAYIGYAVVSKPISNDKGSLHNLSPDKKYLFYLKKESQSVTYYQSYAFFFCQET